MGTSKIHHESVINSNEVPSKEAITGREVRSLVFIFMVSWITLLPSCAVEMRTPRHNTSRVVIENHAHVNRFERREHNRMERHNRREHHDNDDNR